MTPDEFLNSDNRDTVYQSLQDFGASKVATSALMGDIQQESSFHPTLVDDGGTSFGLFQVGKPLFNQFHRDSVSKGIQPGSRDYVYNQSQYILSRFKAQHPDRWKAMQDAPDAPTALKIFRSTPDWGYGVAGRRFKLASVFEKTLPKDEAETFLDNKSEKSQQDEAEKFLGEEPQSQEVRRATAVHPVDEWIGQSMITGRPSPQTTPERFPQKTDAFSEASKFAPETLSQEEEAQMIKSVEGKPIIPSDVIKAGYKTSPLYWAGKWLAPDKTEAIAEGLARTAAGFTTPENAALLATAPFLPGGLTGKVLGVGLAAYFEAQAIRQFPEQWQEFKDTSDPVKKWQIGSQMAVGLGLPITALIAVGGMTHPDELTPQQKTTLNEALEPIVKGEEHAEQRSYAQVQERETTQREQAGTEGEKAQPSDSDNVKREAERVATGGLPPQTPEVRPEQAGLEPKGVVEPELSKAEMLRMQREHEEALLEEAEQHLARGGTDIVSFVMGAGGLPTVDSPHAAALPGELNALREEWKKGGFSTSGGVAYKDLFKKTAGSLDKLLQGAQEAGFDVETRDDVINLVRKQLRSGKKIYGSEARGQALADEKAYGFTGQDLYGMGVRPQQLDVAQKIIRTVQKAVDLVRAGLFGKAPSFEPPKLNIADGGKMKPPPDSIFSPDTPPDGVPEHVYAMRVTNSFKRWWERFWPRDLAVHNLRKALAAKGMDASPVISAHQRFIAGPIDFLENFSTQPFWKSLRGRSDAELINLEDQAVKQFRAQYQHELSLHGDRADRMAAKQVALARLPKWFQDALIDDARIQRESADYRELGLDPPVYTGDPYLARLTNENGKDIVDLNPGISTTVGRALRTSIGSFDNSRVHPTMKDGIKEGTQYEPVSRAVFIRELTSARLHATANLLRELKGKVLFDDPKDALAASPNKRISAVRGLGPKTYYARSPEEAIFLEQNVSTIPKNPFGKLVRLGTTYLRDWNLVNPLPHITKNMFVKYTLARVNAARFKADVAEYSRSKPSELKQRFDKVMPFPKTAERIPSILAREVGTWGERAMQQSSKPNTPSRNYIFQKADPAMRFSLWKDYVRKGLSDQDAANNVWIDLIRYDANSGGMNFWKSIPFNFFVPWRTGTYVTLGKALRSNPVRTILYFGAIDYLREMRYRQTGRWTHFPHDYLEAPLGEAINGVTRVHDLRSARNAAQSTFGVAATTLLFGPGGGQAPSTIKDVLAGLSGDPSQKARIMNMFWGLSQIYNLPAEWTAFEQDGNPKHLVDMVTTIAVSEHSALKYEPRRLMKWLPEWMPGMQKTEIVKQAEALQEIARRKREKGQATYEERHAVSRTFQYTPEQTQMEELRRAAGLRGGRGRKSSDTIYVP